MEKILIIGKDGNLGRELQKALDGKDVTAWDYKELDITNQEQVNRLITELSPTFIFNCAAYTNVDGAETDYATAEKINATGVDYLANTAKQIEATVVHYSTGMIFSGDNPNGYDEQSEPNPVNTYGKSKLAGEELLKKSGANFYIIRTAWLYAKPETENSKKSFNEIMLDLATKNSSLKGVVDEIGPPTWAKDLAEASVNLVHNHPAGVYHIVNSGQASRLDWTKEIMKIKNIDVTVEPVSGNDFPRPAKRCHYELLINTKLPPLRSWQDALKDYLTQS